MAGKELWVIPDGFMNNTANGSFISHEAVCVLNTGEKDAQIEICVYFEDREPVCGFDAVCRARRTNHIRLDRLKNRNGEEIPRGISYALLVKSDVPVVVQHSRMDVSQAEMALMTTIAY